MNLPDPNKTFLDDLSWLGVKHQLTLSLFLWDGKTDRIKRLSMFQTYKAGGLKMVDVNSFLSALICLKITWLKRILTNDKNRECIMSSC